LRNRQKIPSMTEGTFLLSLIEKAS